MKPPSFHLDPHCRAANRGVVCAQALACAVCFLSLLFNSPVLSAQSAKARLTSSDLGRDGVSIPWDVADQLKTRLTASEPTSWRPVQHLAETPTRGVTIDEAGLFWPVMENNINYLLKSFSNDHMLLPFRLRAGRANSPPGERPQHKFWDGELRGSNAGRFLMGAGETLRWIEHAELRRRLDELIDGIEACREANGYVLAFPPDLPVTEEPNYARAWFTHGLIEAGISGNRKAWALLRGHADWFNRWNLLPRLVYWNHNSHQGHIASTRTYFSPVGKSEDLQVAEKYYVCDWWMDQLAARDPDAIWKYPLSRPHSYLITSFEAYLDHYRATSDRRYLDAMLGAWDIIHDHWEHVGGSMAICEDRSATEVAFELEQRKRTQEQSEENLAALTAWKPRYPSGSYHLTEKIVGREKYGHTGETCGSVFWIKFNQRLHQLYPTEEKYVGEIEKSLYNVCLPNQVGELGIRYHARLEATLDSPRNINTCCEGQGTRIFGSLPEYIYSTAKDGLLVNLFEPSTIRWTVDGQEATLEMKSRFPFDPKVELRISVSRPVSMQIRVRVPAWAVDEMSISVNGVATVTGKPGTYATLQRSWVAGDVVSFTLPIGFRVTRYTGTDQITEHNRYAIEYGPVLLAAAGPLDPKTKIRIAQSAASLRDWLRPKSGTPLHFTVTDHPGCEFMPLWDIGANTFTCFPVIEPTAPGR